MKKPLLVLFVLGILVCSISAQDGSRTTRPRVVPTPTPLPPPADSGNSMPGERRAPVLGRRSTPPTQETVEPKQEELNPETDVIRVETNLVTMPVSVLDRDGRFIGGLRQRDFRIFENGLEQPVGFFQSVEQPFTVVLLLDVSPSTAFKIDEIQDAAISFIRQLRPDDRVMVISFDSDVRILSRPTSNRMQLEDAIRRARIGDGTSLYEAVDQVINREFRNITGRKAIVLFTDGVDTTSHRADYHGTLEDAEETDSLIYPIRYNTLRDFSGRFPGRRPTGWGGILGQILLGGGATVGSGGAGTSSSEYDKGLRYLEELALKSGGPKYEADTVGNLDAAFSGIAEELRRQYSLGYYPEKAGMPGERRQIRVRVMLPNVVVRAKNSYVFGQNADGVAGR
ncbi:MAG TPA: hypothetical protein DEA22_04775 [Blastocatellia bacterium]|nr:hypothetical protein [Blastocatellia bacterium]